jgi:hypothetical protein
MKTSLLFTAVLLLATPGFAQSRTSTDSSQAYQRPAATQSSQRDFHARSRFGDTCCFSYGDYGASGYSSSGSLPQSYGVTSAKGGPNWQASNFVTFEQALAMADEHPTLAATPEAKSALIQQMLDLIQEVRTAQDQKHANGDSGAVKWADLKPAINPADYQQPQSTYMDFSQALALGEEESEQKAQPALSLGEVAQEERAEKPADEKATIKFKQDSKGNAIIVHKQPQQ